MKKAKRLLAVLLAAVMIFSVAAVPSYAYKEGSDNWHNPGVNEYGKYYFTYDQACGYLLDLVDELLANANLKMTCDELDDMVGVSGVFTTILNLDGYIANDGGVSGVLNFTTLDDAIRTLYSCIRCIKENGAIKFLDAFGGFGDLRDGTIGLTSANLNKSIVRATNKDSEVLEMLIEWVYNERNFLRALLAGGYSFGLLNSTINGLVQDALGLPNSSLDDVTGLVKDAIYVLLVDSTATQMPSGMTIDDAVQKLVNWALIDGTGTSADTGAFSVLGEGAEPLLPGLANQPGGASLYGDTIQADRDLDGVPETCTMNFYQLVHNVIRAALDTLVVPMLADVLYDALDVEITEQYPGGDPAILQDTMFVTIVGAVEGLATSNGAPAPEYTEEDNATPVAKINALLDWFFNKGGLDTFIRIDYQGIHLTDNFMSLLNDVARLAINLLPGLGLFAGSMDLAYSADDLNLVWYHDASYNLVDSTSEDAVDQTYITFETEKVIYPTAKQTVDNVTTITAYAYLDTQLSVNTSDSSASDYVNPDLIRPNYVISTDKVYACLVKMLLDDMIDGCYFPEWADDIPSVLAYGFASLVAPDLPENDYFTRLDAYHELMVSGAAVAYDANGKAIDALPYSITKTVNGVTATIPKAALDIIASWGASQVNGSFPFKAKTDSEKSFNVTFEQFLGEICLWAVTAYMPILSGSEDSSTGTMTGAGVWKDALNVYINAVYSDFSSRTYKDEANFDAVYDLIDDTIFTLLPTSWIPNCAGSFDLFNNMLFETISNFDLQGILGILSVNNSADAELGLPVVTVLVRIIDRVLAFVFNDNGLLLPEGRAHVTRDQRLTSITTLGALLDASGTSASLPTLIYNILTYFYTYRTEILGTVLPMLVSSFERPYDQAYLGSKGVSYYKVADLENYVKYFNDNVNAEAYAVLDNRDDARAAIDGNTQAVKTLDGTQYELRLSNGTVFGTYATLEETMAVQDVLNNAYYVENVVDETTTTYTIYARKSYLSTATAAAANDADGATWGEYSTYSNFTKATLTGRTESNPLVSYNQAYRYFGFEDFAKSSYVYNNVNTAVKNGEKYVDTYNSFATNDLPSAYHEWMMFSINGRLKTADLYDANDDGRSVLSDTDSDYVASTDTDPGYPVDGTPGVPEAMYPFSTSDATAITYHDKKTGEDLTVYMNSFNSAGFEQLALALEYANDSANDVELSTRETEALVRLALNTVNFDITPKLADDGTEYYNDGSFQWDGVVLDSNRTYLLETFCDQNGYTYEKVTAEDGTDSYVIKHKAFALLDSSFQMGLANLSSTPVSDISSIKAKTMNSITDEDKRTLTVRTAYVDYIDALTANRRSLYNYIDSISYRYEVAEANRSSAVDTTMLSWALNHFAGTYKNTESGLRNLKYTGNFDETTGQAERVKIYTTSSYAKFRNAYDFAQSVFDAAASAVQAEDGLTQSIVTAAYLGIIDAVRQLKPFEGFADWTQLDAYIALATEILNDPNKDDPVLGYESGLDVLETSLTNAQYLRADAENIDSERQAEIDANAAALKQAIGLLVYKSVPQVIASDAGKAEGITTSEFKNENNYITGFISGLTEGVGINEDFNDDLITVVGMREDSASGTEVVKTRSGHGYGTGAYYMGYVASDPRFRYYAVLYGDINGDTRIDGTDASALELYILQQKNNTTGMGYAREEAGDINHDGAVDPQDVQSIIDHYTLKETINQKAN